MLDALRADGARLSDGAPLAVGWQAAGRLGGARRADHAAREPDRRPPDPDGGARCPRLQQGRADDLRHQGRQPPDPRRLARPHLDGLRGGADRHRRALLGDDRVRDQRRRRRHVLLAEHAGDAGGHLQVQSVRSLARSRQSVAQRARPLRRGRQAAGGAAQAAGRHLGDPAAQQGTALRAGSPPLRRHQAGHAHRQGRHRQDDAGAGDRAAEGGRGAGLLEAAGLASDLPAGARRRVSAGRHRGEAEPLDAADLRQRRVPDGALQDRAQERTLAIRS